MIKVPASFAPGVGAHFHEEHDVRPYAYVKSKLRPHVWNGS